MYKDIISRKRLEITAVYINRGPVREVPCTLFFFFFTQKMIDKFSVLLDYIPSSLRLNNIPLHAYTMFCLLIHSPVDTWVASIYTPFKNYFYLMQFQT